MYLGAYPVSHSVSVVQGHDLAWPPACAPPHPGDPDSLAWSTFVLIPVVLDFSLPPSLSHLLPPRRFPHPPDRYHCRRRYGNDRCHGNRFRLLTCIYLSAGPYI